MHTIRLREPWKVETQPGRVIYRRHFNRPTGLGPREVVRLVVERLQPGAIVGLNGGVLPDAEQWDVTAGLQPRNAITVEIASPLPADARPFEEVRLEIES